MKKILSLILAAVMLASFAGCSAGHSKDGYGPGAAKAMYSESYNAADQIQAGQMTAAELRDLKDTNKWIAKFASTQEGKSAWETDVAQWGFKIPVKTFRVSMVDESGNPVYGQQIRLNYLTSSEDSNMKSEMTAVTDVNGEAVLFGTSSDVIYSMVFPENTEVFEDDGVYNLTLHSAAQAPKKLDLLFMVDTTGSMGDELDFLKAELKNVVSRVAAADENLDIRVSVNFYRDFGDEYVVREFAFTGDVDKVVKDFSAQSFAGGGDFPEAVHKALESVVTKQDWRRDAVKLCLLVLDTPLHTESEEQGVSQSLRNSISAAAENGIRIIPVTASGIDDTTEHLMRYFAVMTGGTYVFITGHSGIGGEHKAPDTDEEYTVEYLNECLIRIICEYCNIPYVCQKEFIPAVNTDTEEQTTESTEET